MNTDSAATSPPKLSFRKLRFGEPLIRSVDARHLGAGGFSAPRGGMTGSGPKVINLRSLPGRTGAGPRFSGPRLGSRTPAPGAASGPPGIMRGPRARSSRDGSGRGGGGGGNRGGRRGNNEKREKKENAKKLLDDEMRFTRAEQSYLDDLAQGVPVTYNPSLTLESLVGDVPVTQGKTSQSLGQRASILASMRLLAGGVNYTPDSPNPQAAITTARVNGVAFFNDPKDREYLGKRHNYKIRKATKDAILNSSVLGLYPPVASTETNDILGRLASYHNKNSTYQPKDHRLFEDKVKSLIRAPVARPAAAPKKEAEARA